MVSHVHNLRTWEVVAVAVEWVLGAEFDAGLGSIFWCLKLSFPTLRIKYRISQA